MINKKRKTGIILLLLLFLHTFALATEYQVDKSKDNLVKFTSHTQIQDFDGTTKNIDGYLYNDGNDLASKSDLYFEVDLRTLDTGIGLRNRDMREDYLETDKYPMAHFKGKVVNVSKISDNEYKVSADGNMFIHGVTKPLKVNGTMKPSGNGYIINTKFDVKLSDYNIKIPKLMFLKLSEVINLALNFYVKGAK
jgi:polyisoprenoid-binding protein YceI